MGRRAAWKERVGRTGCARSPAAPAPRRPWLSAAPAAPPHRSGQADLSQPRTLISGWRLARRQPLPGRQGHHWGCTGGKKQLRTRETAHAPRYSATQDGFQGGSNRFGHFRPIVTGPRKIGKPHADSFFFSRRKWAGGRRILQGGGAAVSPASACGAQASPAARYPTPSGRALGLLLRCRQWWCGQGLRSLCLAECLRVPMPHGCTERRWGGPDQL